MNLSFSRLDLAQACSYPWTSGLVGYQREDEHRDFGSAVSSVAECLAVMGDAPYDAIAQCYHLSVAETHRLYSVGARIGDYLDGDEATWLKCETAFALDVRSGECRALGTRGRDYSDATEVEIPGSSDLEFNGVARDNYGKIIFRGLVVRDWKTGRYTIGKRPRDSGQMRALGLAAARTYGADEVCVQLAQADEDGVRVRSDVLTAWDLDGTLDWIREVHAATQRRGTDLPRPGAHCRDGYCSVLATCPATLAHERAVLGASVPRWAIVPHLESPEHAAYVRERARALEEVVKQLNDAIERFAATTPIPLPNGKHLRLVEQERETVDLSAAGAWDALVAQLGDRATDAVERKTSKSKIFDAAKSVAPKRGATALSEKIYDSLRACGALKVSTFATLKEV